MNIDYAKHTLSNNIDIYFDTDSKFNVTYFDLGIYTAQDEDLAAKNTLMTHVLGKETGFTKADQIERRLSEYYGSNIVQASSALLNLHWTSFAGSALTDSIDYGKLAPIDLTLNFLAEMINMPKIKYRRIGGQGRFDQKYVEHEKLDLQKKIGDIVMNKGAYAMQRFQKHLYKDPSISRGNLGEAEEYDPITTEDLVQHYRKIMNSGERFKIFMTGNFNQEKMIKTLEDKFTTHIRSTKDTKITIRRDIEICDSQTIIEEMPGINQSKLFMVYKTGITYDDDLRYASAIMDTILGGSPSSKIFSEVREKHSLAYSAGSGHDKNIGLQFLTASIDAKNYGKTAEVMIEQVKEMQAGNFSSQDIDSAKKQLINSAESSEDSAGSRLQIMQNLVVTGKEELITKDPIPSVKKVKKKDIIEAAKRINLDSEVTYLMRPKDE